MCIKFGILLLSHSACPTDTQNDSFPRSFLHPHKNHIPWTDMYMVNCESGRDVLDPSPLHSIFIYKQKQFQLHLQIQKQQKEGQKAPPAVQLDMR